MAIDLTGIVDWLRGWFYDKGEVNTYLNAKANKNLTNANMNVVTDSSGNITTEAKPTIPDVSGKIDTAGTGLSKSGTTLNHSNSIAALTTVSFKKFKYDAQGHITGTANVTANDLPSHYHSDDLIIDQNANTYVNIGNLSVGATQQEINSAINTTIGDLKSFKVIEVVSSKPTASASTMNKLYIVSENGKVNVYYTKQSGSGSSATYSWQEMDTAILDDLSVSWNDITGKPSTFTPTNHTHTITNNVNDTNNILVPNGADYTVIKNTSGQPVPLDLILQAFGSTISNKQNKGECITSIALVPKSTDATGAIKLYYGDEP